MRPATCVHCTRDFPGPFDNRDRLPRHLDALVGTPCAGSGAPAFPGLWLPFGPGSLDWSVWPLR